MLKLPPFNILRPRNRDELNAGITGCKDEFKFLGGQFGEGGCGADLELVTIFIVRNRA